MLYFRITKYNPIFRNEHGHYKKDDWSSVSDIGKTFDGELLTAADYLNIENAYVKAITMLMKTLHIKVLTISKLEKRRIIPSPITPSKGLLDTHSAIVNNQKVSVEVVANIVRLALREDIWCELLSPEMEVYFGYDYYMYAAVSHIDQTLIDTIEETGLFVEQMDDIPWRSS